MQNNQGEDKGRNVTGSLASPVSVRQPQMIAGPASAAIAPQSGPTETGTQIDKLSRIRSTVRIVLIVVAALGSLLFAFWLGTRFSGGWPFDTPPPLQLTTWAVPTSDTGPSSDSDPARTTALVVSHLSGLPIVTTVPAIVGPPATAVPAPVNQSTTAVSTTVGQYVTHQYPETAASAGGTSSPTPVLQQATPTAVPTQQATTVPTMQATIVPTVLPAQHIMPTAAPGQQIASTVPPTQQTIPTAAVTQQNTGLLNLNTATETQMRAILHVRRKTAQLIIAYRTAHGPFHTLDDLLAIPLSKSTVRRLSKLATVY